jgi:putative methyltransferase (TIGR04325 family)
MAYKKLKNFAKRLLGRSEKSHSILWLGDFDTWENAEKECSGYNAVNIIDKVSEALTKVKNGDAEYERDSYLFYTLDYNWSLLALILKVYLETNKKISIADFGGSLGSSYFQNRKMLNNIPFHWIIIEQPHYVEKGKKHFENTQLSFKHNLSELIDKQIDIVLFSSVLQYISQPEIFIQQAIQLKPKYIYIERTSFIERDKELITVQQTPAQIYEASYVCRFFVEHDFIKHFTNEYDIIANVDTHIERDMHTSAGERLYWKGFILKQKKNA